MKAILRSYNQEASSDRVVEISDHHKFEDGPYGDSVPFAVGSNQSIVPIEENKVLTEMARTLFVTAYASASQEGELDQCHPKAGAQQDWMTIAPPTPESATLLAAELIAIIQKESKESIGDITETLDPSQEHSLGYYLAMEMLGSGVCWADDHPEHDLKLPYAECWISDPKAEHFEIESSYRSQ